MATKPTRQQVLGDYIAQRMATERDVKFHHKCLNPRRRKKAEKEILFGLRTYFPLSFYHPFTNDQQKMAYSVIEAIREGDDKAISAARGGGKTTIIECTTMLSICYGWVRFVLICGATGGHAEQVLHNIRMQFETNDRLLEDFPEVCIPIRALEGSPRRAEMQTVNGMRTFIRWQRDLLVFPKVKGSKAGGAVLMTRGADSAIRGIKYGDTRPDLVVIDDIETRESAESITQTEAREKIIERDLGGLAAPGKRLGRIMLCTRINRKCLAYKYTDRTQMPGWRGECQKLLIAPPAALDDWEEYKLLRKEDPAKANAYYDKHRKRMDHGAVLANRYRYIEGKESSALQHIFNIICDRGQAVFDAEYNSDPPVEEVAEVINLTANHVAQRLSGIPRRVMPNECTKLVQFIDCSQIALHFVVAAFTPAMRGFIIDHGVHEVNAFGSDQEGVERALLGALHARREYLMANPYIDQNDQNRGLDLSLVDSGWKSDAVYQFCKEVGFTYRPSKGFGDSTVTRMQMPIKNSDDKRVGDHWFRGKITKPRQIWIYHLDADYWKVVVHERFLTPEDRPGSLLVFGDDKRVHHSYAHHIISERKKTVWEQGKGERTKWVKESPNNHFLDGTVGCCVAASILGVGVLDADNRPGDSPPAGPQKTWFGSEMDKRPLPAFTRD